MYLNNQSFSLRGETSNNHKSLRIEGLAEDLAVVAKNKSQNIDLNMQN